MSDTGSMYLATPALITSIAAKCIATSLLWRILPCKATGPGDEGKHAGDGRERREGRRDDPCPVVNSRRHLSRHIFRMAYPAAIPSYSPRLVTLISKHVDTVKCCLVSYTCGALANQRQKFKARRRFRAVNSFVSSLHNTSNTHNNDV